MKNALHYQIYEQVNDHVNPILRQIHKNIGKNIEDLFSLELHSRFYSHKNTRMMEDISEQLNVNCKLTIYDY